MNRNPHQMRNYVCGGEEMFLEIRKNFQPLYHRDNWKELEKLMFIITESLF